MKPIHAAMAVVAVLCMGSSAQGAEVIDAAIRQAYEEGYRAGYADGSAGRFLSTDARERTLPSAEFPVGAAAAGKPPVSPMEWWEFAPQRGSGPDQPAAPGRPPAGINTGGFE